MEISRFKLRTLPFITVTIEYFFTSVLLNGLIGIITTIIGTCTPQLTLLELAQKTIYSNLIIFVYGLTITNIAGMNTFPIVTFKVAHGTWFGVTILRFI